MARAVVDNVNWRWASSLSNSERAHQISPNHPTAVWNYAFRLNEWGRVEEALTLMERAMALDPQNINFPLFSAFQMINAERYDDAMRYSRQFMAMAPDHPLPYMQLALSASLLAVAITLAPAHLAH